jgi:cation diffusion facilitator family transporter
LSVADAHGNGSGVSALSPGDPGRVREVKRVTWTALVFNVAISAAKLAAGIFGQSQAIVADAVHSASDSVTDVAVLIGVRYWSAPADARHPHGHRRIETLMTAAVGLVLVGVAGGIVYHALVTLPGEHAADEEPGWVAFIAAAVSIVGKEGLYRWTAAIGRRIGSPAVVANAWHHRSDGLSSVPAALAVLAVKLLGRDWMFIDHVGAVIVSLLILRAAWRIVSPALGELIDVGASEEKRAEIRKIALATDGVREVHKVRTRYSGSSLQVDLHVRVDGTLSVRQGHDISERVKERLVSEGPAVLDVVVHLEPVEEDHSREPAGTE